MAKRDYSQYEKKELIEKIEQLEEGKKYGLVWEDKTESVVKQCQTELPVLEEIKNKEIITDKDKPTNILIEGDNYHALSVLNYTHAGKIDVIYIDPPYNTGGSKEWKFNDRWIDRNDTYRHSKWLSFMSHRLRIVNDLLKPSGVILISIDDNEYAQLKLLCDKIFSEKGFIGSLVWEKKKKGSHLDAKITNVKEYILVYTKTGNNFKGLVGEVNEMTETYPCFNPGNGYSKRIIPVGIISKYRAKSVKKEKGTVISAGNMQVRLLTDLVIENGILKNDVEIEAEWRYDQKRINEFAKNKEIYITQDLYLRRIVKEPRIKKLKDLLLRTSNGGSEDQEQLNLELDKEIIETKTLLNLYSDGWGSNEDSDNEQREFFGKKVFDYPKPVKLIKKLIESTQVKNGIVLDFFAGTGTTAEGILRLNNEGYNNKFILCTNNEDHNSGGARIATDICYPRIKKVIEGYKNRKETIIKGLTGNLKYFKTIFVPKTAISDDTKYKLVNRSTEMICLREDTFDKVLDKKYIKIFENKDQYTAILFHLEDFGEFKKELHKLGKPIHIYVFSLTNDTYEDDFKDIKQKFDLCPIPESILEVYRKIFKE